MLFFFYASFILCISYSLVDTGRKLNVHKTLTSSERFMYVQIRSIIDFTQSPFTCSKLTMKTLEQRVKYVQS